MERRQPNLMAGSPGRPRVWGIALVCLFGWAAAAGAVVSPAAPEGMVYLSGGAFVMGLEGASNKTPHRVVLDPFFMDRHEVTQAAYETIRGTNPSGFSGPDHPVEQVTWAEARGFCHQQGKRLPTEAEWEFAARGGTTTRYYWGAEFDFQKTWNEDTAEGRSHPVAQKPPNPAGLYDMAGNVWEWTADWYDRNYYERSPEHNPPGPESGAEKVIRGGSWYSSGEHQMSATRYWAEPNTRNSNFGFRCVKDLLAPEK